MESVRSGSRSVARDRSPNPLFMATLAFSLGAALVLALNRGIWLDEAYSIWFAGHDMTFLDAARTRWIRDGHPILFPALTWLFQPLLGGSVYTFRTMNFLVLLAAVVTFRHSRGTAADRNFCIIFYVLTASTPFFLLYAAEFRSYFFQILLAACLLAQMRLIVLRGVEPATAALLAATAILLINLHYVASLVAFLLLGSATVGMMLDRRWREAGLFVAAGAFGAAGLAASLLLFLNAAAPTQVNFTPPGKGAVFVAVAVASGVICNAPAALLAVFAARERRTIDRYAWILLVTLLGVSLVYLLYNLALHNLVLRFLIAAVPISSALIAHLLAERERSLSRWTLPICGVAVVATVASLAYGLTNDRWETYVATIKRAKADCARTRVVALNPLSFVRPQSPILRSVGSIEAVDLSYRLVARAEGFRVATAYRGQPTLLTDGPCPVLVWVEHRYVARVDDAALVRAAGLVSPTGRFSVTRVQASRERILLSVRPAA